jgi:hypothetical protein
MLRKTATLAIAAALGTGSAIGIAACGEDREGEVTIEDGGGTDTSGTGTETGAATTTAPATTPTETSPTETSP